MDSRFIQAYSHWFTIIYNLLFIVALIFFIRLPKEKRANIHYWLPFLILTFTMFYENVGAYTNYNPELKIAVNAYLGNTENPNFNLWLFNITKRQLGPILYLVLIKSWLEPSKKKYINWMIFIFIPIACILQFSGMEPLYYNQPIIFSIGANMILIGSGLYFIGMITVEQYLASNPLRLVSFWQMTFIMFANTLTYISAVALMYLYQVNPVLGKNLQEFGLAVQLFNLGVLTLTIASPFLPGIFEKEPYYEFS